MNIARFAVVAPLAAALLLGSAIASAAQISFPGPTGWNVGDAGTTFQEWSAGTTAPNSSILAADALVKVTSPVLGTNPTFSQTGGFLAGSGGLYSFSGNYSVTATIPNHGTAGAGTWVLVQSASTVNPEYDPEGDFSGGGVLRDAIKIYDKNGNLLVTSNPSDVTRSSFDPNYPLFGGVGFEKLSWEVFLPGYTDNFSVRADTMIHSSIQAFRVDSAIAAVPEPSSVALLALGATGLAAGGWRRRRRNASAL